MEKDGRNDEQNRWRRAEGEIKCGDGEPERKTEDERERERYQKEGCGRRH